MLWTILQQVEQQQVGVGLGASQQDTAGACSGSSLRTAPNCFDVWLCGSHRSTDRVAGSCIEACTAYACMRVVPHGAQEGTCLQLAIVSNAVPYLLSVTPEAFRASLSSRDQHVCAHDVTSCNTGSLSALPQAVSHLTTPCMLHVSPMTHAHHAHRYRQQQQCERSTAAPPAPSTTAAPAAAASPTHPCLWPLWSLQSHRPQQ